MRRECEKSRRITKPSIRKEIEMKFKMKDNVRIVDKFAYHLVDCDCQYCANRGKRACKLIGCAFEDIKQEAIANGRIERKRGWGRVEW